MTSKHVIFVDDQAVEPYLKQYKMSTIKVTSPEQQKSLQNAKADNDTQDEASATSGYDHQLPIAQPRRKRRPSHLRTKYSGKKLSSRDSNFKRKCSDVRRPTINSTARILCE